VQVRRTRTMVRHAAAILMGKTAASEQWVKQATGRRVAWAVVGKPGAKWSQLLAKALDDESLSKVKSVAAQTRTPMTPVPYMFTPFNATAAAVPQ
jgi:hypothetical protein